MLEITERSKHVKTSWIVYRMSQSTTNIVNIVGTVVINILSIIMLVVIHSWKNYSTTNFLKAILKVGHFWLWTSLLIFTVIPSIEQRDFRRNKKLLTLLGIALIIEYASTSLLALTIHFVNQKMLTKWIASKFMNRKSQVKIKV